MTLYSYCSAISDCLFFSQGNLKCSFTLQGRQCDQIKFYFYINNKTIKHTQTVTYNVIIASKRTIENWYHHPQHISSLYVFELHLFPLVTKLNDTTAEPKQLWKTELDFILLHTSLITWLNSEFRAFMSGDVNRTQFDVLSPDYVYKLDSWRNYILISKLGNIDRKALEREQPYHFASICHLYFNDLKVFLRI